MAVLNNNNDDGSIYFWLAVGGIVVLWLASCLILALTDDIAQPPKHEPKKKEPKFIFKTSVESEDDSELLCEGFKKRKIPKDESIKFSKQE